MGQGNPQRESPNPVTIVGNGAQLRSLGSQKRHAHLQPGHPEGISKLPLPGSWLKTGPRAVPSCTLNLPCGVGRVLLPCTCKPPEPQAERLRSRQ